MSTLAFGTVYRVTLNCFATSMAETLWVWGFDLRERRTPLCHAPMLLSKECGKAC